MMRASPLTLIRSGLPLAARLRPVLQQLPMHPPALALATALNRWLLPRLPAEARAALSDRPVQVDVTDLGLSLRLVLRRQGFAAPGSAAAPCLRIAASGPAYCRLLAGEDDADRLFFERQLLMEGDTEMGLVLKNTLDALGPILA